MRRMVVAAGLAVAALTVAPSAVAKTRVSPVVYAVVEGRENGSGREILVLTGARLTAARSYTLTRDSDLADMGEVTRLARTASTVVLGLPDAVATDTANRYTLRLWHRQGNLPVPVTISRGGIPSATIAREALTPEALADIDDAALLGGRDGSYYLDLANSTGQLDAARYDAFANLLANGHIGSGTGPLATASSIPSYTAGAGITLTGTAFSAKFSGNGAADNIARSDHDHDARYPQFAALAATTGTVNATTNLLDWSQLKSVPAEFSDGVDNDTTYSAGTNVTLTGTTFSVPTLPWTALTGRPAGLDDGDDDTTYTAGSGLSLAGGAFSVLFGGTGAAATAARGDHNHAGTYLRLAGGDAVTGRLDVSSNDGVLFTGSLNAGSIPATGAGVRFMWYPRKAALRAGETNGSEWDDASVGRWSTAFGNQVNASGDYSFAAGGAATASDFGSTAIGWGATASGQSSVALGAGTASDLGATAVGIGAAATGHHSVAIGWGSLASGAASTAFGTNTTASGDTSTAAGYSTLASGLESTAMGQNTTASGEVSTALGSVTTASGAYSTAMGSSTVAQAFSSLALGRYNTPSGSATSWVTTDPVLVVGNGSSFISRSNALTLLKNGNMTIAGSLSQNSDARLKKDIAELGPVLQRLAAVRGVSYEFKDQERDPSGRQVGLLAQEVRAAFPELVTEGPDGTLSVAYGNFGAVLLEAVKEQQEEIEARDRELAVLRQELQTMRAETNERLARVESLLSSSRAQDLR